MKFSQVSKAPITVLGPLCYKLIAIVTYYVETGLSCIVY